MTITVQPAPAAGAEVLRENLMLRRPPEAIVAAHALPTSVDISQPYPVYTADLPALLDRRFLQTAVLTSWQYILRAGEQVLGVAEIAAARKDGEERLQYASLQSRRTADALIDVIAAAERLELTRSRDYELRILRAPELYFYAVWLHADFENDRLIAIRPAPAGLQPGALMTPLQLTAALTPLALLRRVPEA